MSRLTAFLLRLFRDERHSLVFTASATRKENVFHVLHACARWRAVRNAYVRLHPRCALCGHGKQLQVHHIVPWHVDESLRYHADNLVTLCQPCHFRYGHGLNWKRHNMWITELADWLCARRQA